jgi:hypothetical protein
MDQASLPDDAVAEILGRAFARMLPSLIPPKALVQYHQQKRTAKDAASRS